MLKQLFLLFLIFSFSGEVFSQQRAANISFTSTVHNYGDIKEEDGVANYQFEFINTGSVPLIIHNVSASCGCTAPSWTREPIMPGEKGYVQAGYNPAGRPGHFDKYVTVHSNAGNGNVNLRIIGRVIPKPLSIEDEYRYAMGGLRLKTNHVSFGTVYSGKTESRTEEVINHSDQPITVEIRDLPAHIRVKPLQTRISPRQKAIIEIVYDASKINDWDFMINRLGVLVNGHTERTYQIIISANVQEDFSGLGPEELASAPRVEFAETTFNMGRVKQGTRPSHEFVFSNSGKSDLIIRKVSAPCGCTAAMLSENLIPPGKTGKIATTFNTAGRQGNQNQTITVITNDPQNPRVVLFVRGEVEN